MRVDELSKKLDELERQGHDRANVIVVTDDGQPHEIHGVELDTDDGSVMIVTED